ncbi:MAG TPA: hypothetical protein VKG63_06810 [Steroidobacteraceae bacterium]|nr:hypothetical protein [Steroidobacteraceae bacterium]
MMKHIMAQKTHAGRRPAWVQFVNRGYFPLPDAPLEIASRN